MMSERILVYGATGRLGRLVVRELISRGARVCLGGRSETRLSEAALSFGASTEWGIAPIDDPARLRDLLAACRVVVNAGPSFHVGERLIEAALEAGVHYIDAAGEQPFIRGVFERRGSTAERRGLALVPACGFDYALGDCLAHLVALDHQPASEVTVAYAIEGEEVSSNSLRFAADTFGGGEVFFESGGWTPARSEIYRRVIDFPAPFGRQAMARYGSGEVVTVPRHTQTDLVTSLITTRSLVPHRFLVPLFPYLRPLVALVRRTPARRVLSLAAHFERSSSQSPEAARPSTNFAIVSSVRSRNGATRSGVAQGGNVHQITAATLAFGACALASPTFDKRGALPTAAAIDPTTLLDNLRPLGVTWRVERSDTRRHTP